MAGWGDKQVSTFHFYFALESAVGMSITPAWNDRLEIRFCDQQIYQKDLERNLMEKMEDLLSH